MKKYLILFLLLLSFEASISQIDTLYCLTINEIIIDSSVLVKMNVFSKQSKNNELIFLLPKEGVICETLSNKKIVALTQDKICSVLKNKQSFFMVTISPMVKVDSTNEIMIRASFYELKKRRKKCNRIILLNYNTLFDERNYNYYFGYDEVRNRWFLKKKT